MSDWGALLGKLVRNIFVSDDQQYIRFDVGYNQVIFFETYGDCCSETWFADVIGVRNLLDCDITGIEILELPDPDDGRTRQEVDSAYGVRLKTKAGDCDVIYRNSSNGYYGGSASTTTHVPEGVVWEKITTDWQAGVPTSD